MTPYLVLVVSGFSLFMLVLGATSIWCALPHRPAAKRVQAATTPAASAEPLLGSH